MGALPLLFAVALGCRAKHCGLQNATVTAADLVAAGRNPPRAGWSSRPAAGALPRRGHPDTLARFAHRNGAVAARGKLEREIPGRRQRRMGREHRQGAMAAGLRRGYAAASNDTGHKGGGAAFALHPEKVVDFGYRAMHEMTVQSKAIIQAFYRRGPQLAYYQGCSTGGRQGLMEAQRYPEDFDAIIAGAPVNNQIS